MGDNISNLEVALLQHEKNVDVALKRVNQLVAAVKAWKKATAEGNLVELSRQQDRARELVVGLEVPIADAADAWDFDAADYLSNGAWREELIEAARVIGLRVFEEQGQIISSPVLVSGDAGRLELRIGKVRSKRLRPSLVAADLKKMREAGERDKGVQQTLEFLFGAARMLDREPGSDGAVKAKLRDIYNLFCAAPGWKKENPEAAFAQSLYTLHKSAVQVTRIGKKYEFGFPAGQPKPGDIFEIIDETGRPIRYYTIHFR